MSHTTHLEDGWVAIHDGDFGGTVELKKLNPTNPSFGEPLAEIEVPFEVLKELVASFVRNQRISRLGSMSDDEVLGVVE